MNKSLAFWLICFCCLTSFIKAQVTDSFSDGDYTANPTWTVNAAPDFTVASGQLKSANTATNSSFFISTPSSLANNCQWEFYVNLQFNPSGTNYVDAYLTSDVPNLLAATINGYFVRIGNTLDEVCLYKRSGSLASAVKIIDGADGLTNVSNNTLKIRVVRTAANLFTLERDNTGTGNNYVNEGSVTDATYTTSASFGFYVTQSTTSFTQKHIFDDIVAGPIVPDLTPPLMLSASATSSLSVDLLFNETLDPVTSQATANYTLSPGIGSPISATRDASNFRLVHLNLSTALNPGTSYTLSADAIQDLAGNAMTASFLNFSYLVFGTPAFKDLVINEIYADPSPLVNLTTAEFVEIYNRSASTFNLAGLKLTDNSSIATLPNYILAPDAYVIICPVADTAQFSALGYMNKLGVGSFPSLNNSADNVYLKTAANAFVDSLNYKDTWYGSSIKKDGGYSLEQINPNLNAGCAQAANWTGSNDPDGGTPGFINSVYSAAPDVSGPKIMAVSVVDSLHLSICFDDVIDALQLCTASNYSISGGIGTASQAVAASGNTCATLSLASPLLNATNYTLSINGISDCHGNALSPNSAAFSFYRHKPYDVVINELMPDPDPAINLPVEEYVELKNRTPFSINLKGWRITTTSSSKKLPEIIIRPDSFVVLTGSGNFNSFFNDFGIFVYEVTSLPSLLNSGATLTLLDSTGTVMHSISYNSSWYNDVNKTDGGWSLEQVDAGNPCEGQSNWHASRDASGGTPGRKNSVAAPNPDQLAPRLERIAVIGPDTILLLFSEPMASDKLQDPSFYLFDNGLSQPSWVQPVAPGYRSVKLKLSASMQAGILYHCTVATGLSDCFGNALNAGSVPFALPEQAQPNDVVINEVLSDPPTGGIDYLELYNRSSKTIDLKDLRIGSMDTLSGSLKDLALISAEGYLLFPESYVLLSENGATVRSHYQTMNPEGFLDLADLPAMNSDADVVTLCTKAGTVIDHFSYSARMHFPLLASTKGVSLERIDFNRPSNDRSNWNSAAEAVGFGTPAYRNSQYLKADGGSGISIPEPLFSPDNDGYQDVLNISYKLDEPGKAANVYIYDSKGRQVRHLIRNEQLPQEGVFSWNGITDVNEKAPIGIYIVYVELFNLSGKVNKYKLACTLAGKL